ncbi:MAG: hypothetical protein PHF63_04260 [Herbinix sp.]|nr:hypothetical protein [Herbinix sp.]
MEILFGIAGIAFYAWEYYAMNKYWYSKRNYIVFDSGKFFARKLFISIFIGWIFIIIQILEVLYHWLRRIIEKQPGSVKKQKKRKRNAKPQNIQKSKDMTTYNLNNSISRSQKHNEMGNVHVVDFNAPNRTKSNYKSSLRRFFRGIFLIIRWSLFIFLAIMTLGCFLTSIISGIVMLVSATLMCPAVNKLIKSKLPTWLQMALSLFIFCIAAVLLA